METLIYVLSFAVFYWTFMVAVIAILHDQVNNTRDMFYVVGVSAIWPILGIVMLVGLPYGAVVASTKRIRADLHNRKLLREFEVWLAARDKGTILPKKE